MRAVLQRVTSARVEVDDEIVGAIDEGWCALIGVTHTDSSTEASKMAARIATLRVFDDDDGVMNRSVADVGGAVLVVSQFTLYADTRKGRRPGWGGAAPAEVAEVAEPLIERLVAELRASGLEVATGRFRADMVVHIVNDGPATVIVDVDPPD